MSRVKGPEDRFGMPDSAVRATMDAHEGVLRAGMYVLTCEEVTTWPAEKLNDIIMDWMWESPSEIIPNNEQISQVLAILKARPDAESLIEVIEECRKYMLA